MSLGNNILRLRKEYGFSQEQLGGKLNVSRQTISNWEIGETSPNSEQLKSLSKEFNVSIDELLDNTFELKKVVLSSNEETTKKLKVWQIVFLIVGSPVWLSLLIALFVVIFSLYITLWILIISLWVVFSFVIGSSIGSIIAGIVIVFSSNNLLGIAMIGVGIFCLGLSIFLFYGCKMASKGIIFLTRKAFLGIKSRFIKKEEV